MKICVVFMLMFVSLAGCSGPCTDAEKLVRKYNEASINAYRTGDFTPLSAIADEKESGKIRVLVDIKRSGGLVLESQLQSLEVTSCAQADPDSMTVETRERWRYHDRSLKPGVPPGKEFVADMSLRYTIRKVAGVWKVGKVKALSTKYIEPAQGPAPAR